MADQQNGEKTEQASRRKLDLAREEGRVARSRELPAALGIVAGLKLLMLHAPTLLGEFRALFALCVGSGYGHGVNAALSLLFPACALLFAKMLAPLAIVPLMVVAGSLVPGGWVVSLARLKPSLARFNPLTNLQQLASARQLTHTAVSALKLASMGVALGLVVHTAVLTLVRLQASATLAAVIIGGIDTLVDAALTLAALVTLFAIIDVPIQHFYFMRSQRMSRQDMKDEYKTTEGDPQVRGRIRQLQRQLAQRALRKTVPLADVVLTNPTHYAVALRYDTKRADAPFVVAKGVDEMAQCIRAIAHAHRVPVLVQAPLARAIYRTSQVNQQIPAALYRAVAHVLTYVFQLKAFQAGRRPTRPSRPADLGLPEPFPFPDE